MGHIGPLVVHDENLRIERRTVLDPPQVLGALGFHDRLHIVGDTSRGLPLLVLGLDLVEGFPLGVFRLYGSDDYRIGADGSQGWCWPGR